MYTVCGIYLGSAVIAAIIVSVFLDKIVLDKESSTEDRKLSPKLLISTFRHLFSSPIQAMLIPMTIYSGVEQAFIQGDFTKVSTVELIRISSSSFLCSGVEKDTNFWCPDSIKYYHSIIVLNCCVFIEWWCTTDVLSLDDGVELLCCHWMMVYNCCVVIGWWYIINVLSSNDGV